MSSLFEKTHQFYHTNKLGRLFDAMKEEARQTVHISVTPEEERVIGGSRLGGTPDLPNEIEWPTSGGHPLAFVAQINLKEVHDACPNITELPTDGILFFFRQDDEDMENFGYDIEDFMHNKVIHYTGELTKLQPRSFPEELTEYERYTPVSCHFIERLTLPEEFSPWWDDDFELTEEENELFYELIPFEYDAQILGHPVSVQGPVEDEAATAASDKKTISKLSNEMKEKLAAPFGRNSKDWRLLLSVDSISECNMMWGDVGMIYFMITDTDLAEQRFDRITCIFQCG